jgi:hypothetical protein
MMNSGLPSLLDAIFGKKDLSLVSLDELYELINEFPSFNAAHFLLSKKLKQDNEAGYEPETRRTALYFNNPFWLQTILDDEMNRVREARPSSFIENIDVEKDMEETYTIESITLISEISEKEELPDEPVQPGSMLQTPENAPGAVSSFDELLLKYQIETEEPAVESIVGIRGEQEDVSPAVSPDDSFPEPPRAEQFVEPASAAIETGEGISNEEYGIFEEEPLKPADQDLEDFDRPIEGATAYQGAPEAVIPEAESTSAETENIIENQNRDTSVVMKDEGDYEAFDRPVDKTESEENAPEPEFKQEMADEAQVLEADNTDKTELDSDEPRYESHDQMPNLSDRFREGSKSMAAFDPKKAESIVFAPYHMIDYFASQGIRLVLEDQPADHFGKQLKSFTDWLKVMKRLPPRPVNENTDEKEVDRIRHFASHSIEERDILTESMAEVLAKQGMIENAIALYLKLSLIYPPKSAYFAARIEQLKASLP